MRALNLQRDSRSPFFRILAVFMALVLVFPAAATGLPPALHDIEQLVRHLRNDRPSPFTTSPRVRQESITARRDAGRDKWWSPSIRADYEISDPDNVGAPETPVLLASIAAFPLVAASFVPSGWGSGSSAGYPLPGEGAEGAGGSGLTSAQGLSGTLNTSTGNGTFKLPVLSFPVKGELSLSIDLFHNSQTTYSGALGAGWSHSYDSFITEGSITAFVQMPDGLVVPYAKSGATYTRPSGWFALLTQPTSTTRRVTFKDQTTFEYSKSTMLKNLYLLAQVKDRHGNTITINRGSSDQITTIVAPDSRTVTFGYTGGKITSITGPTSRVWSLSYTSSKLDQFTYPTVGGVNPKREFGYDSNNNITSEKDPELRTWTWTYNSSNDSLATFKDPASSTSSTVTYFTGYTEVDRAGVSNPWVHTYSSGKLYSIKDPDGFFKYFTNYNADYLPQELEDANGNITEVTYDSMGNVTQVEDPLGKIWTYGYNGTNDRTFCETPFTITNPPPAPVTIQKTQYTWSGGVCTQVSNPEGEVTTFTYDPTTKDLTQIQDAEALTTVITYNGNGDITKIDDPAGIETDYTYDDYGRTLTKSDSVPNTTEYVYDAWGRLTEIIHPDLSNILYTYNKTSQRLTVTNEIGKVSTSTYDHSGRLVTQANPLGDIMTYFTNDAWRVHAIENGRGYYRYFQHTDRGDLWFELLDDYTETYYTYDGNGNVTSKEDDNMYPIEYEYDLRDQLTKIDYYADTDTTFAYDDAGRRTQMVDGTGTTNWTYDLADRVTLLDSPQGDISYTYRDNGQRLQMTEVGSGNTDYGYDAFGRLEAITNRFSEDTAIAYDALGRIQRKTFENGQYELYGYDSRNRVTDIDLKNSSNAILQAQDYVFDDASRVTSYVKGAVTTTYGYDDANQLTSESRTGYSATYTYDDNGNRLTRSISGGVSETYSYDSGDKLTGVTWSGGYKDFAYDNAGRMTEYDNNGSVRYFAYDEEGRMTGISGAQTASFSYNGLRTRTAKTENSITSNYKRDGSGVTSPALNDGSAAYTAGTSERRGSTTTYLHSGLKNAEAQTGTSQTIAAEKTYDAFGNLTASTGTWQGPFGYAGQFGYQEDASGLKLLGHRYYDPTLGRFLTRDPIQDGRNWYVYCENDSLTAVDPLGQSRWLIAVRAVMAIADFFNGNRPYDIEGGDPPGHHAEKPPAGSGTSSGSGSSGSPYKPSHPTSGTVAPKRPLSRLPVSGGGGSGGALGGVASIAEGAGALANGLGPVINWRRRTGDYVEAAFGEGGDELGTEWEGNYE